MENVAYIIFNLNNFKLYVGSTQEPAKRIRKHFYDLSRGKHHSSLMQADFVKEEDFKVFYFPATDREDAYRMEAELLDNFREIGAKLYNIGKSVRGGDNITYNPNREDIVKRTTDAVRLRYSKLSSEEKRRIFSKPGEKNGMFGKTHTAATRKKLSEINLGRVSPTKGVPFTPERHKKHLLAMKKRDISGEKNGFYGKRHSNETREKIGQARKGMLPPNIKAVQIEGKTYMSLAEASRSLGVPVPTVHYRIKSNNPKFTNWVNGLSKCPTTIENTTKEQVDGDE